MLKTHSWCCSAYVCIQSDISYGNLYLNFNHITWICTHVPKLVIYETYLVCKCSFVGKESKYYWKLNIISPWTVRFSWICKEFVYICFKKYSIKQSASYFSIMPERQPHTIIPFAYRPSKSVLDEGFQAILEFSFLNKLYISNK